MNRASLFACCIPVLLLGVLLSTPLQAGETVRVGVFDNAPIVFRDDAGQVSGIAVDVLEEVARRHDWRLEYHYASWNTLLQDLDAGRIDILTGIAYTSERAGRYRFTSRTLVSNWGVVYQSEGMNLADISELSGRRIALMRNSIHSQRFDALMQDFGFDYTPLQVPHYSDVFRALEQGNAEAGVVNRIFSILNEGEYPVKPTSILFNPIQVRFAAPGGAASEHLALIDTYLEEAGERTDSVYYQSLRHWLERTPQKIGLPGWLWPALGGVAGVLLLSWLYLILVRRQVGMRTRELQEAESRFSQLAGVVSAVFWMATPDWKTFLYVSPGYKTIWGDEPQRLYHDPDAWLERVHEDDRPWLENIIRQQRDRMLTEYTFPDFRIRAADGTLHWISARIYPIHDDAGRVVRLAGIALEVTRRQEIEQALRESETRYRTIIEHAPEAITILDVDTGRFVDVNHNAEKLFNMDRRHLLEHGPDAVSPPLQPDGQESATLARQYVAQAVSGEVPVFEWVHRDSEGNDIECEVRLVRLPDKKANLVRGSITDITERKRIYSELQQSQRRLQTLISRAQVVLFVLDKTGRFTLSEGRALDVLGLKPGQVVGQSALDMYKEYPEVIGDIQRALSGERFEVDRKVGDYYFETHYSPLYDEQGRIDGTMGVAVDVTERVISRKQLETEQQKLQLALDAGGIGIWEWDMNDGTVEWSANLEHMYGLETGTFRGRFEDFARQVYPGDLEKISQAVDRAVEQNRPFRIENRIVRADGEVRWVYSQAQLKYDDNNQVVGMLGITSDLTEIKKAEAELREREAQLAEAQRIAHLGSWELDMTTLRAVWSDEEFRLLGYEQGEVDATLNNFMASVHPEDVDSVEAAMHKAASSVDGSFEVEHRVRLPQGGIRHVLEQGQISFDAQGNPERFIGTTLDITGQKQAEQELLKHKYHLEELVEERTAELQRINKELESFSYSVSHDLRAPLRAIDGFSLALQEDYQQTLDETAQDYLGRIRQAAANMSNLIDSLLKLSRLTRSKFERKKVDLSHLVEEVAEEQRQASPERDVRITIAPGMTVFGDEHMLRIMLNNLLNNAVKYSRDKPRSIIDVGMKNHDSGRQVFYVADNGAGFDMRYADKLFGAFQRLHNNEEFEGLGIGLATVQRIIHRHGGRIWAEASPGEGAVFYFSL